MSLSHPLIVRVCALTLLLAAFLFAGMPASSAYNRPGQTERVSGQLNGRPDLSDIASCNLLQITWMCDAAISADGRFVAYVSARALVREDINPVSDIYLYDR